jgi:SAM-dependent methyltransferase
MSQDVRTLYDKIYSQPYEVTGFAYPSQTSKHPLYKHLKPFIDTYGLEGKRCLEVGVGRGAFQNLVSDYFGIDVSTVAGKNSSKPFSVADAMYLPFQDNTFGGIWTTHVLEHIKNPESALQEMWRTLKPGGYLFAAATWQVGTWAAKGYQVRPYSDFNLKEKLIKASVPIRNSVWFRAIYVMPRRLFRLVNYVLVPYPVRLHHQQLDPNVTEYIGPDSSAESSIDPFDVWLWYRSRDAVCLNYPTIPSGYLIRTGALIFQKPL